MVISDFDDRDCDHSIGVNATAGFLHGRVARFKNQPIRVREINGVLSSTVPVKLMTPIRRKGWHH